MSSLGRDFRDVVGAFPTGVCVITTELHGHPSGMTMNSFTSVSLDPLLVLVSFIRESRTYPATIASGRFAVNILHRRQQEVALAFANRGASFPSEHTVVDQYGYVAVRHALALLRCEVFQVVPRRRSRPRDRRGRLLRGIRRRSARLSPRAIRRGRRGCEGAVRPRDRARRRRGLVTR